MEKRVGFFMALSFSAFTVSMLGELGSRLTNLKRRFFLLLFLITPYRTRWKALALSLPLQLRTLLKRKQVPPLITSFDPSYSPDWFAGSARELLQCLCIASVRNEAVVAAGQSTHYETFCRSTTTVELDCVGLVGKNQRDIRKTCQCAGKTDFDYRFSFFSLNGDFWDRYIRHVTREGILIWVCRTIPSGSG